jgi:Domain of unknown function (DUF4328)
VRPGAPPPPRRYRVRLGPTPRYTSIPRWGLQDHVDASVSTEAVVQPRSSTRAVEITLAITLIAFGLAAFAHLVRYGLLLINRTILLNPIIAGMATWGGVVVSVLAFFTMIASMVVLTNWLIARRSAAYAMHGVADPRSEWELWLLCLLPLVNLFWAPVFVFELARVEGRLTRLRNTIVAWWCVWWLSVAVSAFAFATSFTREAQAIANNTVATTIAYLAAMAALLLVVKVYRGFEASAVDRPVKRWVVVSDESSKDRAEVQDPEAESAGSVELQPEEPAA